MKPIFTYYDKAINGYVSQQNTSCLDALETLASWIDTDVNVLKECFQANDNQLKVHTGDYGVVYIADWWYNEEEA